MAKAEVSIKIKIDDRLYKIVQYVLVFTKPLWYIWREQIFNWLSTGRPIPLIRYRLPFDNKWKWLRS